VAKDEIERRNAAMVLKAIMVDVVVSAVLAEVGPVKHVVTGLYSSSVHPLLTSLSSTTSTTTSGHGDVESRA